MSGAPAQQCDYYKTTGFRKLIADLLPGNNRDEQDIRRDVLSGVPTRGLTVPDCQAVYSWLLKCELVPAAISARVFPNATSRNVLLSERALPLDTDAVRAGASIVNFCCTFCRDGTSRP